MIEPFYIENLTDEICCVDLIPRIIGWGVSKIDVFIRKPKQKYRRIKHPECFAFCIDPHSRMYVAITLRDEDEAGLLGIGRTFRFTKDVSVGGDISWLFNYDKEIGIAETVYDLSGYQAHMFHSLFEGNEHLVDASRLELPATTLSRGCYSNMFANCVYLKGTPVLPATNIADHCYCKMFKNCVSLETAPDLPAGDLYECCYTEMFKGCTRLERLPRMNMEGISKWLVKKAFNVEPGKQTMIEHTKMRVECIRTFMEMSWLRMLSGTRLNFTNAPTPLWTIYNR